MTILSFDPGLDGALAIIDSPRGDRVRDLPTRDDVRGMTGTGAVFRRIDNRALYRLLLAELKDEKVEIAIIEGLATGQSGRGEFGSQSSTQTIGSQYRTRGNIECVCELIGLELQEVYPQTWKKPYGLKSDKVDALVLARKFFPDLEDEYLKRKSDNNRAEALLIGHWALRHRKGLPF